MTQGRQTLLVLAALAVVLAALSAGLRPDAFYVGDPGVKLLAAHHAASSPWRPLQIPLPTLGADRVPHVSPFFTVHDDHAHAVTSELFPLLTAPLLALFGLRGVYIWPALGFLLSLAAIAWLGRALDRRRSGPLLILVAALGTPLFFYGLEFWEHAPAVAAGTAAAALLIGDARRSQGRIWSSFVAGALFGFAVLLRPEAAWFAFAVVAASRTLTAPPRLAALGVAALGAATAVAPLEIHNLLHFGTIVPGHLAANVSQLPQGWTASRAALASEWLIPFSPFTAEAGTLDLLGAGPVAIAAVFSLVWRSLPGTRTPGGDRTFLWLVAGLNVLLVVLTAPNDGGGQWGPRYLLFTYVPLTLLGADVIQRLVGAGVDDATGTDERAGRRRLAWRRIGHGVLALLLLSSLWIQRSAYRELRSAKSTYGRIVDFVRRVTVPGATVVTDTWWLDLIAAPALLDRKVLFAGTDEDARGILVRMGDQARTRAATVIRSREDGRSAEGWTEGTCYAEDRREELAVRSLVAIQLRLDCPGNANTSSPR